MIQFISKKVTKTFGLIALTGLSGLMSAQSLNWSLAGPVYNAGRVRNIVIDKADASGNTIYAGSTSSGVFKTTDGGANWGPLDDQSAIKNISYMAQAIDNTIYVATGEGFLRPGQMTKAQLGTGLYKLSGTTLVPVSSSGIDSSVVGHTITRIACSPVNANVIALATNKGVFISSDAGQTFSAAPSPVAVTPNAKYGMDVKFDGNGVLYCSVGNERSITPAGSPSFNNTPGKVYRSIDNTLSTFKDITPVASVNTIPDANYGRIELAIAPSNSNFIYASCAKKSDNNANSASMAALFASVDGGDTWSVAIQPSIAQHDPLTDDLSGLIASGDYAHVLVVHPTNPNELFIGGYGFYLFFNYTPSTSVLVRLGSEYLINTQYYLHENVHDIKMVPGPNSTAKFYFVTDAGIYRSTDLSSATSQTLPPSFQPFYKGLVTGQFNSVSIETFPVGINTGTANGSAIDPAAGFIGGTGGNGLNYFSGTPAYVTQETNYLTGEIYDVEYSKVLPEAAILTPANGSLFRTSDARSSQPTAMSFNTYSSSLSNLVSANTSFAVGGTTSGSNFRLWENYGQANGANDPVVFYNDTLRTSVALSGTLALTTTKTFTFSVKRPTPAALIDSMVVRTGTVSLNITGGSANVGTPFSNPLDAYIKLPNNYSTTNSVTPVTASSLAGPVTSASVSLNANTAEDLITVNLSVAPFANYTVASYAGVPDAAVYYRTYVTVYYKYKAGDVVPVVSDVISTRTHTYYATLAQPLSWAYGSSATSYTISANTVLSVQNPTYTLRNNASVSPVNITQSSPVFTVQPLTSTAYTTAVYGDYLLSAKTITYALTAGTDTNIPGSTYIYSLEPGSQTISVTSTTTPVVFNVTPSVTTTYTITQSSSTSTLTNVTYSTVNTPTYVLNPGNVIQQGNPVFTVNVPLNTSVTTVYTITGQGLPTTTTSITYNTPARTFSTVGSSSTPFSPNNPYIKVPTVESAKFALSFNSPKITNSEDAVVVAKNALSLNDALNFVRLSQTGAMTTESDGSPTTDPTNTITVDGKPTVMQWSNSGTELYYATSTNKLYRVSNINLIMDFFSPGSYGGKLHTDLFKYAGGSNGMGTRFDGANPNCPYRTTLIGSFTKRITSLSITKDDTGLLVTLDDNTGTNLVSYCGTNLKTGNTSNITFTNKTTPALKTLDNRPLKMYCSLLEMHDSKKAFIGTDNGVFYTADVTAASPTWTNAGNNLLPIVQVYDIEQQTMDPGACYNSGEIYVATYGRGIWTSKSYRQAADVSYVGIKEQELQEKNISIYPNPTSGDVTVAFKGVEGESAAIHILDISGRVIRTESLKDLNGAETEYTLETSSLNSGIYLVNVVGSNGVKRTAKLIVTK